LCGIYSILNGKDRTRYHLSGVPCNKALPDHVRAEIEILQSSLSTGRLVPSENLNLTLNFLGEQDEYAIEEAHQGLSSINAPAFDLRLAGVGSFGTRSPQVIFAEVSRCPDLLELEKRTSRSLRNSGLEFQKRRFRPHVTVARLPRSLSAFELDKVRGGLAEHAAFSGSPFRVASFQLYRSILSPRGALHEPLASYLLRYI